MGCIWAFVGVSGRTWAYLGISGRIWAYLGISWRILAYLGVSGRIWAYLGVSGHIVFYGVRWRTAASAPAPRPCSCCFQCHKALLRRAQNMRLFLATRSWGAPGPCFCCCIGGLPDPLPAPAGATGRPLITLLDHVAQS